MRLFTILLLALLGAGQAAFAQDFEKTPQGARMTVNGTEFEVQFYNPSTVRVIKSPAGREYTKESLSVVATPASTGFTARRRGNAVRLESDALRVELDLRTGTLSFATRNGRPLLREKSAATFTDFDDAGRATYKVKQGFVLDNDETVYGLGILQNGKMSQRNMTKHMSQGNTEDFVPFIQSIKGWGLFWDNYSPTNYADSPQETSFESEVGECVDYYFMVGGDADGVIAQMRALTGEVPMFPLWTYGFWQSRERYKSQNELLEVVNKYRELGVPLDGIIQDWQYWGNNYLWNAMEFLNEEFPNPRRMIDSVHNQNAHMAISIWSSFGPMTKQYRAMEPRGMLLDMGTWPQSGLSSWPPNREYPSGVKPYDPFNPEARAIYWDHMNKGLFSLGIDAWWMDSTEPDHLDFRPEDMDNPTYLGSFRSVRNAYPLMAVGGVYDHQRAVTSDKRVFILTRSGFAGQQRYGANVWSGDVGSSWENLRRQIPAGLNFTLTGNPNFNSDIGGFFAGDYNRSWGDNSAPKNPMYQELFVRWMQHGVFTPMMRSHGADIKREIYYFGEKGEPVYDAIESAIHLRYSLLPYIYSTSWDVTKNQSSFMRALFMDFADDRNVWDIGDEYMFGRALLVAPIVEGQYTPEKIVKVDEESGWNRRETGAAANEAVDFTAVRSTAVYLPAGAQWYDFWTNERHAGGREITRQATLALIPLYVRAGSILPIGPAVQYAEEKPWDDLEIRVYRGADGRFVLYEDEFDNYNYEQGQYTEIAFGWDDSARTLTIGARAGDYPGMIGQRNFRVVLVDAGQVLPAQTIFYDGDEITVKL